MKKLLLLIVSALCLFACSDIKEMQGDIADLKDRVDSIEEQLKALQAAYDDGKIIKEVKPLEDESKTGWIIVFSDDSSIVLYNGIDGEDGENGKDGVDGEDGKDGRTPALRVNSEGYWEISYDNGLTYDLVLGTDGEPIASAGEGLSLRVVVNEDGLFVIESFYESNPEVVVESIVTPYSSSPGLCISSIVMDPLSGVITLSMADGSVFTFNLDVQYPTGIVVLAQTVTLAKGGSTSFMFRVNPSNAVVNLDLSGENPMFEIDMALPQLTRSYVTPSENYVLDKIETVTDANGNLKEGQYKATLRDLDASNYYSEGAALVLNTKDGKGNSIQVSSEIFKVRTADKPQFTSFSIGDSYADNLENDLITVRLPYGTDVTALKPDFQVSEGYVFVNGTEIKPLDPVNFTRPVKFVVRDLCNCEYTYTVSISYSDLPVVYINTMNDAPIKNKVDWVKDTEIYMTNAGEHTALYTKASIRGRGNTTWGYPKKPYAIKLDSKESVLGMPKHKRWVLLANYLDKSHLRNSICFEIARRSDGLDWTPRGQHVDVVLNGVFQGTYYLCEQIKIDEKRVNITEMEPTDVDPEAITGGYLLELDVNFDEPFKFRSPYKTEAIPPFPLPYMLKEPEELNDAQFTWIQNHIYEVEKALFSPESTAEDYLQYIDLDSFIDYWFVYEITGTSEPTHPKSVYMWKERGQKIHAGPVWDFDFRSFHSGSAQFYNRTAVWNSRILNDPATDYAIRERWVKNRDKYLSILEEIDRQYALIKESVEYNDQIWPLDYQFDYDANKEKTMTVDQVVEKIKSYYQKKFDFMDKNLSFPSNSSSAEDATFEYGE